MIPIASIDGAAIYMTELSACLEEAAHAAAAIHTGIAIDSVSIGQDEQDYARCILDRSVIDSIRTEDYVFVSMTGVVMTEIYHLDRSGHQGDRDNIRKALLHVSDPEKVERKARWKARRFVIGNRAKIFQLAHAIQQHRELPGCVAEAILRGEVDIPLPDKFRTALWIMSTIKPGEFKLMRAFERQYGQEVRNEITGGNYAANR